MIWNILHLEETVTLCWLNITQIISDLLTKIQHTHAICRARVPSTLALSYLVMYGVVILFWFACWPSPAGRICTFSWSSCSDRKKTHRFGLNMTTSIITSRLDEPYYLSRCFGVFFYRYLRPQRSRGHLILHPPRRNQNLHHRSYKFINMLAKSLTAC